MKHVRTITGVVAVSLLPLLVPTASAAPPNMYHTVSAESASFDSAQLDGCLLTEIFAAATTGHWAGDHGPSVKQDGPSAVFLRVTDTCAAPVDGPSTAAAGPGGAVLLEVEATSMQLPLVTDQQLRRASAVGTLEGTDQHGTPVTVGLEVVWTGAGPLEHTTVRTHDRLPDGNVSSTANEWGRPATAQATVHLGDQVLTGTDAESRIERTKSHCIEIPTGPTVPEEFFPCFGFPG